MPAIKKASVLGVCFFLFLFSGVSRASLIEFHFTGQLTVLDSLGGAVGQSPIDSTFTYNTNVGIGSGQLFIAPTSYFFGLDLSVYDVSMEQIGGVI